MISLAEEEELSGSDADAEVSMNSSGSGPVARIPSFDTTAMETTNHVTLEMLKINAVMENQKKNRTEYKQQLKDLTADIASQVQLYGGEIWHVWKKHYSVIRHDLLSHMWLLLIFLLDKCGYYYISNDSFQN